jgi:hypothetical protein
MLAISMTAVSLAQSPPPAQVELGDIRGAVVTLYYYDGATGGKGAMVPLPGGQNPQEVEWDSARAAPGTYTFYKVPQGTYYVEAVHGNRTWFAIVAVDQGTSTANVAIPPFNEAVSPTAVPAVAPLPSASASPSATPSPPNPPTPSPGITTLGAVAGLALVALHVARKKE